MVERRLRRWKIQRQVVVEWPVAAILLAKLGVVWGLRLDDRKASRVQYRHTNQPCNIFNGAALAPPTRPAVTVPVPVSPRGTTAPCSWRPNKIRPDKPASSKSVCEYQ